MTVEGGDEERSPFTRPGFVSAAVVVALILVLGVVVGVVNMRRGSSSGGSAPTAAPTAGATQAPVPVTSEAATSEESVCGLGGEVLEAAELATAPAVDRWDYQGTTAYPVSAEFGPAAADDAAGFRYCFQRSPEGAVSAAANAVAQGGDSDVVGAWLDYFLADSPQRDAVLSQGAGGSSPGGARLEIVGFRLLAYDGRAARVDIAVNAVASGQEITMSMVYELIWEDGDWKLAVNNPDSPVNVARIPHAADYITWGE